MMDRDRIQDCMKKGNDGIYLDVKVNTDSSENSIEGINQWRENIEVRVENRAKEGMANKDLVQLFSEKLDMNEEKIKIVKGNKSSKKRLFISSVNEEGVLKKLSEIEGER